MNKASFEKLHQTFEADVTKARDSYRKEQLRESVSDTSTPQVRHGRSAVGLSEAAEVCALRAAVAWEAYRSEWHLYAVNRDSSVLLRNKVAKALKRVEVPTELIPYVQVQARAQPKHLPLRDVRTLLDTEGRNITFSTEKESRERAIRDLADPYKGIVLRMDREDWKLIRLLITARNAIVHQSNLSMTELNFAIKEMSTAVSPGRAATYDHLFFRKSKVRKLSIGAYLNTKPAFILPNRPSRATHLCDELLALGHRIKP